MSNALVFEDAFNMLCGGLIGIGIHRKVFDCKLRPELVVKVEYEEDARFFANVAEQKTWDYATDAAKKWLAPCEYLSPDGRILLQRRVDPVPTGYVMPEKLPAFLSDHKRVNFGILDGSLVCCDYAMINVTLSTVLRKVSWS